MYEAFTLLRVLLGHERAVIPATRSNIGIRVTVYGANRRDIVEFEADSTFSTNGKKFCCIVHVKLGVKSSHDGGVKSVSSNVVLQIKS